MKSPILILWIILCSVQLFSQNKKSVEAIFIETPPVIDGVLDEPVYKEAEPARDFLQLQPYNGRPSYQPSEVKFLYDNDAIYVGAMLFDSAPDSIYNFISGRDNIGMSDYFGVYFDPYNQGQLAYGFFTTPAGAKIDIKAVKREYDNEDGNWDAVWDCKTQITDEGWVIEMRIPYSALRFPEKEEHVWGLNMFRNIRRYNSNNTWNFVDNEVSGFIHQEGQLTGIKNIKPPVRLSFSPYGAVYTEFSDEKSEPDFAFKGGMDLKYGISESFTLDMMLIPDFGQIQSDDQRLNLSPYEIYYSEKRQFFNEGTELFDRAGIFYSRRIGSSPRFPSEADSALTDNETIDYRPGETQIVNATKISGRTPGGWGIGMLNAMTTGAYAELKDTLAGTKRLKQIQPFTNYNVTVVDKSLPNNSYVSLINTSVLMAGNPFMANVTATDFQLRNKAKTYALNGKAGLSHRGDEDKETGYFAEIGLSKNSGKFRYGVTQSVISDKFNSNDLGFMTRNNEMETGIEFSYQIREPFSIFKQFTAYTNFYHSRGYNPNVTYSNSGTFGMNYQFKNNYFLSWNTSFTGRSYDYYEPRVDGRYFCEPYIYSFSISGNTDSRKTLLVSAYAGKNARPECDQHGKWLGIYFRYRAGRHLIFEYDNDFSDNYNGFGWTGNESDTIWFVRRNQKTISNVFGAAININTNNNINLRVRHYWSSVKNLDYYILQENGELSENTNYSSDNQNYNTFTIDLTYRWVFAPGSELSIAWKNSIFANNTDVEDNYFNNVRDTWNSPQVNSISLKVLYYIDYNNLFKRR